MEGENTVGGGPRGCDLGETAAPSGLEGGKEYPLSRTVHDVIAERVDRPPEELGGVLITVAVAGGPGCRPEAISHVHGISRLHAAAVCDALAERRLLVEGAGAVVAPTADARSVAAEVARHAEQGGDRGLAYRSALLAGEGALQRFAFAEALSWLDLASAVASSRSETDEVDRRMAALMETAGWREAPPARPARPPVTREIVGEDLDLPVRR